MTDLTEHEIKALAYFIKFCDGIRDTGKQSRPLLSGSGQGRAQAADCFRDSEDKNMLKKAERRGFVVKVGRSYAPTEAGREITDVYQF